MKNLKIEETLHPEIDLFNNFLKVQNKLDAEMEEIKELCLSNNTKSNIYGRMLFECVKSYIESRIKTVKILCKNYNEYFISGVGEDFQFLNEVDLYLNDSGEIIHKKIYFDLRVNIKYLNNLMIRLFNNYKDYSKQFCINVTLACSLNQFVHKYFSITGPRNESEIIITDDEIDNCIQFCIEYDKLYKHYIKGLKELYQIRCERK